MRTVFRRCWPPVAAVGIVVLLVGTFPAGEPGPGKAPKRSAADKALNALLRDVINRGADLFNPPNNDRAGCAGLYEGALIAVRPLLKQHAKLQKEIDRGLATARATPDPTERAFTLRRVLDQVRAALGPTKKGPPNVEKKKGPPDVEKKKGPPDVEKATLWKRLGGEAGVSKVVDDFLALSAADPQLPCFRPAPGKKVDMKKVKRQLVEFVSQHTGGSLRYTGLNMKELHKGMHITNQEFDRTAEHLKKALKDNHVKPADGKELLHLVNTTRKDIVEPAATKGPGEKTKIEKPPPPPPGGETGKVQKGPAPDKGASKASLSGRVTYKGRPLPAGNVTLWAAKDHKAYAAPLAGDGTYRLTAVPVGEYVVTVDTASVKPGVKVPPIAATSKSPPPGGPAPAYVAIPARYASPEASPLRIDVRKTTHHYDIDLR